MNNRIYKTITLPVPTPSAQELEKQGIYVSPWAKDCILKLSPRKEEETVELVAVTPKELGFTDYPTYLQIVEKAKEQGLDVCPQDTALQLVVGYEGDWKHVFSEPITVSEGDPCVFYVRRDDREPVLSTGSVLPGPRFLLGRELVLARRKVLASDTLTPLSSDSLTLRAVVALEKIEEALENANKVLGVWVEVTGKPKKPKKRT